MRLPWLAVLLLVALPGAAAFPGEPTEVDVAYAADNAPLALLTGGLALSGDVQRALLVADAAGTRLGPIPLLEVVASDGRVEAHRDVLLLVHDGLMLARTVEAGARVEAGVAYGVGIGLAEAPFGGETSPGFLLASDREIEGNATFGGGVTDLVPIDALVSLRSSDGTPVEGWSDRRVNQGQGLDGAQSGGDLLLRAHGPFDAALRAHVLAGAVGGAGALSLSATRAEDPRFTESIDALGLMGAAASVETGVRELATLAEVVNGGVLLMHAPQGGATGEPAVPLRALLDGAPADIGGFALLRSEAMEMQWADDEVRVQGAAQVAITGAGLVAEPPARIGPIPVLSLLLWLAAAGAVAWYFLRRPPKPEGKFWSLRLAGMAAHAVVFVLVFWWWDVQFAETFGTSIFTVLGSGVTADANGVMMVFMLQLVPWALASVLFALPVRILAGVALRYAGRGKSLGGFAKAAGLVVLGAVGPFYALWLLGFVVERAIAAF